MSLPVSKQQLADWILRRLGAPIVNIEITDEQLEDMIDEAVQFFQEYHYDGAERAYKTIKLTPEILAGNNRKTAQLTAPMYDVSKHDSYRVGDRVMVYKIDGTPDDIWIKYDSDERIIKSFFELNDNGLWFIKDSDLLFADLETVSDSDGLFVSYDSDTHNNTIYFISDIGYRYAQTIAGTVPIEGQPYYVDSEGDYVLYDSDKHAQQVYTVNPDGIYVNSNGSYVLYDSDVHTTRGYEPVVDSDSAAAFYVDSDGDFVLYDSDKHGTNYVYTLDPTGDYVREEGINRFVLASTDPVYATSPRFRRDSNRPTFYVEADIQPTRYILQYDYPTVYQKLDENSWVDSDSDFVLYDSDKHIVFQYDSEDFPPIGIWTDSEDGEKVLYDSEKHILLNYFFDSDGFYVDSEGTFVLYDSDKHAVKTYYVDMNLGTFVDSDGDYAEFDSDKHIQVMYDFVDGPYDVKDSDNAKLYWLKSQFGGDSEYEPFSTGVDVFYSYAKYTQTLSPKTTITDDTTVTVGVSTFPVLGSIRAFELRGTTEDNLDSDGYGGALQFADLDGIRVKVIVSPANITVETYILDQTIISQTSSPVVDGTVVITTSNDSENVVFTGSYERTLINGTVQLYNRLETYPTLYAFGVDEDAINSLRYSRSASYPQVYSRQHTYTVRYKRENVLYGVRYSRLDSEVYRTNKSWSELYSKEDEVLNEPVLNFDYSKEGQVGIPVPDNVIGINKIFRIDNFSGMGMWNYEYQYFLNNFDFFYGAGGGNDMPLTNYITTKSYMDLIDNMMNVQPAIRFNKVRNKLYIDTNWARLSNNAKSKNYYLMIECYEINDPEVYGDVYKDKWLKRYATALSKKQWGSNLKKHNNIVLPGGVQIDGQAIYDEAVVEVKELEDEIKSNLMLELDFIIG